MCNVHVALGRISIDELTALVDAPLDNDVSCIEYEDEREHSMSDDSVMLCLKDEFGITDGQLIQKLGKEERDVLEDLPGRHAGVRQLQRLTGISKNIISNVLKTIFSRTLTVPVSSMWIWHLLIKILRRCYTDDKQKSASGLYW